MEFVSDRSRSMTAVALLYLFVVCCYWFVGKDIPFPLTTGDAENYVGFATNLVYHKSFTCNNLFMLVIPPGYSLVLVPAVYMSGGFIESLLPLVTLTNSLFYGQLVFVAYIFLRRRGISLSGSLVGGVLICLTPGAFQYTQDIMSENVFIPLVCFAYLLAERGADSMRNLMLLFILFTILLLTKPIALIPIVVMSIFVGVQVLRKKCTMLKLLLLICTATLPVVFLFAYLQNIALFGDFIKSYPGGYGKAVILTLTEWKAFSLFLTRLLYLLGYTLQSSYFLPLLMLVPGVLRQANGKWEKEALLLVMGLWLFSAALAAIAQAVLFERPDDGHFYVYGRYIEGVIPLVFLTSFSCICRYLWSPRIEDSKLEIALKYFCILVVALILLYFPYEYWRGLNTVGLSPAIYSMYLPKIYVSMTLAVSFAITILLFEKNPNRSVLYMLIVMALSFQLYGAKKEMDRVDQYRPGWKGYVTASEFYSEFPPDEIENLVVVENDAFNRDNRRFIWYLRPVYLKARYFLRRQLARRLPKNSLVFNSINKRPKGFKSCGRFGIGMYVFCPKK